CVLGGGASEDAVGPFAERVGAIAVSERKDVGGVEVVFMLAVVPRRLSKAVIEEAEAAAGAVRDQTVEDLAAGFIDIKPWIEEMSKEPATLGDAEAVRPYDRRFAVGQQRILFACLVAEERDQIAHGSEAGALHDRSLRLANQLVDVAGSEAPGH